MSGLDSRGTEADIKEKFYAYGEIESIRLVFLQELNKNYSEFNRLQRKAHARIHGLDTLVEVARILLIRFLV